MLAEMFSYNFMVRALIAGLAIAMSGALIGVPLVLKKNAMLADGLSHISFAAFVLAALIGGVFNLEIAIPLVILASFLILKLGDDQKVSGDLAVALASVSALALGVFLISIYGLNIDINSYLFGSILGVNDSEVILAVFIALLTIIIYIVCEKPIFALTFDEKFARAIGVKTNFYQIIIASLCSVVVVVGMKLLGALLIAGLILFPALTAKSFTTSFKQTLVFSVVTSIFNFLVGFFLAYFLNTPTGATIILTSLATFAVINLVFNLRPHAV